MHSSPKDTSATQGSARNARNHIASGRTVKKILSCSSKHSHRLLIIALARRNWGDAQGSHRTLGDRALTHSKGPSVRVKDSKSDSGALIRQLLCSALCSKTAIQSSLNVHLLSLWSKFIPR